jgi:hypothetical protein
VSDDRFSYTGPVTLRAKYYEKECTVHARLWTEREVSETVDSNGWVTATPGLLSWHGTARVPGLVHALLDLMGEEVSVILLDGRTGRAFITGYSQESVWVVEIQGAGPAPE